MGIHDSSRTRVAPVFSRLYERDKSGKTWLGALLRLPQRFDGQGVEAPGDPGELTEHAWHPAEKSLPAPRSLLQTLVERPDLLSQEGLSSSSPEARLKREALLAGDPATREEALAALESYRGGRVWFVFEGPTSVDAYLETDRLIVLVEGKRQERGPTTYTTWMRVRHQLLRNLDAALDASDKPAFAFFIVEGRPPDLKAVPDLWQEFVVKTVSPDALEQSLPHRDGETRERIARSFLGVTTWQAVCAEFGIPLDELPGRVENSRPG